MLAETEKQLKDLIQLNKLNRSLFYKKIEKLNSPDTFKLIQICEELKETTVINNITVHVLNPQNREKISHAFYWRMRFYDFMNENDYIEEKEELLQELSSDDEFDRLEDFENFHKERLLIKSRMPST